MPSKRKKKWGKKSEKRREERKRKVKVKTAVSLLNPKIEILLSAHARTSQADILHLDQKAAKCTTCKPVCGKFYLFIAWQWPENHSTSFKTRFSARSPGANGLIITVSYKNILYHYLWQLRKGNFSTNIPFMSLSVIFEENCTFFSNCPFSGFLSWAISIVFGMNTVPSLSTTSQGFNTTTFFPPVWAPGSFFISGNASKFTPAVGCYSKKTSTFKPDG